MICRELAGIDKQGISTKPFCIHVASIALTVHPHLYTIAKYQQNILRRYKRYILKSNTNLPFLNLQLLIEHYTHVLTIDIAFSAIERGKVKLCTPFTTLMGQESLSD